MALVFGIIGMCFFPAALLALICGIIALTKSGDKGRGFALAGTILGGIAIVVAPLMLAILLPALGAARRTARWMQNSTHLRSIHQGMFTYANSNKNYLPGVYHNGEIIADGMGTGNSGEGNTPQARFWMLLDGSYIPPDYAISPSETEPVTPYVFGSGPVVADNYSYAMLSFSKTGDVNNNASGGPSTYAVDVNSAGRAAEWSQTLNSQAIVVSDRNAGRDAMANVGSIHSDPGTWRGSILWNDNHVAFETTHQLATQYANGPQNSRDNIFVDETNGFDALMVYDTAQ